MKTIILVFFASILVTNINAFDHNHTEFDSLLKKYVLNGKVNYRGFQADKDKFQNYLSSLSKVSNSEYNSFSREEKLAFLINAYNAFTIQLILENYPVKSIRKIGGLFKSPWKIEFFELLEEKRNLDWIEHSRLRIDFNEPRIHFAIVCASIGCPILQSVAYLPSKLETQLEKSKDQFLKDISKNNYDTEKNILYLSPIFDWFQSDFTKNGSLIDFVQPSLSNRIPSDVRIKFTDYDWNLNEKK